MTQVHRQLWRRHPELQPARAPHLCVSAPRQHGQRAAQRHGSVGSGAIQRSVSQPIAHTTRMCWHCVLALCAGRSSHRCRATIVGEICREACLDNRTRPLVVDHLARERAETSLITEKDGRATEATSRPIDSVDPLASAACNTQDDSRRLPRQLAVGGPLRKASGLRRGAPASALAGRR